jgi:hypothetical protein
VVICRDRVLNQEVVKGRLCSQTSCDPNWNLSSALHCLCDLGWTFSRPLPQFP